MIPFCLFDVNFSDAVKPKPATTMYIIESNNSGLTL